MKFSAVLTTVVLATCTLAAPLTEKRQARHGAGSNGKKIDRKTSRPQNKHNGMLEEYSSNWAGSVLIGKSYTGVSAEFTVPTPRAPSGEFISLSSCFHALS